MSKQALVASIRAVVERVAASEGLEVVEVELKGTGPARLLRITIDKPGGVTHGDCELVSQQVGTILDVEDVVPGEGYQLEVSSPGVERPLLHPRDWERFVGASVQVSFFQPVEGQKRWEGRLAGFDGTAATVEPAPGRAVRFALDQVAKASLKYDWAADLRRGGREPKEGTS